MKKDIVLSSALILISLILIALNIAGLVMVPSVPGSQLAPTEKPVPGFHHAILPTAALRKILDSSSENLLKARDVEYANNLVFSSIRHSKQRRLNIEENWLLWLMGRFYEPFLKTQNTARLVKGGAAICSESAQVLKTLVERAGLAARFVGLSGHVVLEVKTSDGWKIADPDYGVTYPVGLDVLETKKGVELLTNAMASKGYDEATIHNYVSLFQSSEDNHSNPIGKPMSPRLYYIEIVADGLKWLIPLIMIGLAIAVKRGSLLAGGARQASSRRLDPAL